MSVKAEKVGVAEIKEEERAVLVVFTCRRSCCRDSGKDDNAGPRGKEQMVMGLNCTKEIEIWH